MNRIVIIQILWIIGWALLQVFIFSNINVFNAYNPFVYIIWILLTPIQYLRKTFLICSFLLGLIVDIFMFTGGINAFACTVTAFLIPTLLQFIHKGNMLETQFRDLTFFQKMVMVFLVVLIHHFLLFSLDHFSFDRYYFTTTLLHVISNTLVSFVGIITLLALLPKKYSSYG